MTCLDVRQLSVMRGPRTVLRDVTLSIAQGELVGLIGPNGAGKSTLIKTLLGLVGASAGSIAIAGKALNAIPPAERSRKISYLPQDHEVAWPLTVEKVVQLGRIPYLVPMRGPADNDLQKVEQAMADADVLELRARTVSELSGGERTRVLIARALAQDADLLLADEPTAGLDPAHQIELMQILRGLTARGRTVIVSLHDLALAARWCSRLILLHEGALAVDGKPDEVLTEHWLRTVYGVSAYFAHTEAGLVVQPLQITSG